MRFKLHNRIYNDSIIVEGKTIEEVREKGELETKVRGWKREDMWSEEIKD